MEISTHPLTQSNMQVTVVSGREQITFFLGGAYLNVTCLISRTVRIKLPEKCSDSSGSDFVELMTLPTTAFTW